MEHHTAASMYIPSSTVLAQLHRQTGASGRPQGGTRAPPTGTNVCGRSESGGTHTRACTDATESSGAAEGTKAVKCLGPVLHRTPSGHHPHLGASTPLESTISAAAVAHCTVTDAGAPPAACMPSAAPPLLSPQTSGSGSSGAVQHSLSSARPTSVWLLPQADAEYILSSLTWNVDLLLLLLSHASCPLHLPEAEPLAEASANTANSPPTARSPAAVTASSAKPLSSPIEEEEEAKADTPRKQSAAHTTAIDSMPTALAEVCAPSSIPASMAYADAANVEEEVCSSFMVVKDAASNPRSPLLSLVPTTNPREDEAPPATAVTLRLTWSQYLFRGARSRVSAVEGVPARASTRILKSPLAHSRSDGELMTCTNPTPGRRISAVSNTTSSTSLSIFHAQYLPSLEEFERQLGEHKHRQQQQQQQHPPTLSVTRLEQHLQQQQQQQHHHRRAATNKTFFYSPTPSVISLATTCANMTVNTKAREERDAKDSDEGKKAVNEEEEEQQQQQQPQQRGRRTTAATPEPSLRPSPSHARRPPIIMPRAVDQTPAFILSASAAKLSPQLLHSNDGDLGYPTGGTSPRATTPDGGRAEEEEGTTSRLSTSDRCSVEPAGSPPSSPTISTHSMSQSYGWSRTVSGRGTPQATLSVRLSCSAPPPHTNLIHSSCTPVSSASPYSAAKGGKNARRRRKTKWTRRPRAMRVYVPSITEGPKAASLYAAPTAEAHELLLLLQRKKTTAAAVGLCASTMTSSVMQPSSHSSTASAGVWVSGQPPLELPAPHPSPALTADKNPHRPPSQRVSRGGAGSATVQADNASPSSVSHEQCPGRPPSLSASRCLHPHPCQQMPAVVQTQAHLSSDWAASSVRSYATPNDSLSSSCSGIMTSLLPSATAMPTHTKVSTSPACCGGSGAGTCEDSTRVRQGRDAPGGTGTAHASEKTHREQSGALACTTVPTAPVELPQWVRERPLSALYYQPWGLELLARYEAACHEQQQLMRGGTTRREDTGTHRRASATSSAVSGADVARDKNTPPVDDISKVANNLMAHRNTSLSASSMASRGTSVHLCSFLGPSDGGSNEGTAAAAGNPPQSSDRSLGVSWAEALRQQQSTTDIPGSSDALSSTETTTTVRSNKITATTTMNNSTTIRSTTVPRQLQAIALPEWPAELVAAEEMDAWEETYYFDGSATSPLEPLKQQQQQQHKPPPSRPVSTELATCVAESAVVAPSASLLNRQRRPSRRRSRATYAGDTFRSSAARRAGATSAAAELLHKRKDNNTVVTAAAPACGRPISDKATASGKASPPPIIKSSSPTRVPPRDGETPYDGDDHTHKHPAGLATPVSYAPSTGKRDGTVEGTQQKVGAMCHAARGAPSKAEMRGPPLGDDSHDNRETSEATYLGSGMPWPTRLSTDGAHRAPVHPTRSSADVDVFFFLQMFMRAVLIVFIAQVRLQQQQRRGEGQASAPHDMTCPVAAYLLEQQALAQPISGGHRHGYPSDFSDRGATASYTSDEWELSMLERRALSFVRNYMEDYRSMITACVMRDSREVARRSAQSIFHAPPSATSSPSMAAAAIPGASDTHADAATDPLFRQDVFTRLLNANRVNTAYREAVRAATGGRPGAPEDVSPATSLDDVESLRTAQVYISGKDAAWQPLLMELLQVSRVVQCYGDGPGLSASGAPSAKPSTSAASPQRHLLSSLERFLAHPTRPLFRSACPTAPSAAQEPTAVRESPTAPSAGTSTAVPGHPASNPRTTTSPSLTPAQEKAAALMIEESDAFRSYLLSRYLRDDTAAAAAAAVTPATPLTLRHSHSAPTLSVREAQQWQESSVTTAAAMSPTPLTHAVSDHQSHPPTSSSGVLTAGSLLEPLTWYPYAYMPGTANPYAESTSPICTSKPPAHASTASAMTLSVAMLPLSGRLLWRWVVPAEDTDTYNLSVFFQSSLFSFMQGGPVPMPSAAPGQGAEWHWTAVAAAAAAADRAGAAVYVPTPSVQMMAPPPHPSLSWPQALAARIDAQLRSEALRSDWGEVPPPCMCHSAVTALSKGPASHAGLWSDAPEVVLVHCSAGMHRSCGILVAFLLWLLYQCREVLRAEQALTCAPSGLRHAPPHTHGGGAGVADEAAVKALLVDDTDAREHEAASAEDDRYEASEPPPCVHEKSADADAPWLTSRLLRRIMRHVQQRRNIAVPIRTVQFLLQSFANELQLS